jgi:hypothetical protein
MTTPVPATTPLARFRDRLSLPLIARLPDGELPQP